MTVLFVTLDATALCLVASAVLIGFAAGAVLRGARRRLACVGLWGPGLLQWAAVMPDLLVGVLTLGWHETQGRVRDVRALARQRDTAREVRRILGSAR